MTLASGHQVGVVTTAATIIFFFTVTSAKAVKRVHAECKYSA